VQLLFENTKLTAHLSFNYLHLSFQTSPVLFSLMFTACSMSRWLGLAGQLSCCFHELGSRRTQQLRRSWRAMRWVWHEGWLEWPV